MHDIISGCACFCLRCYWDSIKKVILLVFYYCNLSTYDQNVTTTAIGLQSTLNTQWAVWLFVLYNVITCKSKRILQCIHSDTVSLKLSLFFMFLNIQIYSIILNTDDEQFTLTTKKNRCKSPLMLLFSTNTARSEAKSHVIRSQTESMPWLRWWWWWWW